MACYFVPAKHPYIFLLKNTLNEATLFGANINHTAINIPECVNFLFEFTRLINTATNNLKSGMWQKSL